MVDWRALVILIRTSPEATDVGNSHSSDVCKCFYLTFIQHLNASLHLCSLDSQRAHQEIV